MKYGTSSQQNTNYMQLRNDLFLNSTFLKFLRMIPRTIKLLPAVCDLQKKSKAFCLKAANEPFTGYFCNSQERLYQPSISPYTTRPTSLPSREKLNSAARDQSLSQVHVENQVSTWQHSSSRWTVAPRKPKLLSTNK